MSGTAHVNTEVDERSYILEGQKLNQQDTTWNGSNSGNSGDVKHLITSDEEEKFQTSSSLASFNYINSIIGSGVIGIPYAFHQAGFGLGLLLLVGMALITDYSLVLMVHSGHLSGAFSYQGLMEAAFGKPGFILLSILQFTYPFIAMVSYNVVVGDNITKVMIRMTGVGLDSLLAHREFVVALATVFITIPLCLYRDIARLTKVSFVSLIFISFILVAIFIRLATLHDIVSRTETSWQFSNRDVIPAIGIMAFAFLCHHNTFLVYDSIKDASQSKWNTVTHASVLTSLIISAMFGIAGYATFTGYSQGDLLENYCPNDDLMNISRVVFSITILLTYPIECFVAREVIENTFFPTHSTGERSAYRHVGITLVIVLSTYFTSMTTDCLGVVLEINGVLTAVPLAYVLPSMSYVKLEEGPIFSRKKLPALALGLFGIFIASTGMVMLAMNFNQIDTCNQEKMPYCRTS